MPLNTRLPNPKITAIACALVALTLGAEHSWASSDGAWEEFRQDVERACRAATQGVIDAQVVQVDPHGSESYGFAVLVGPEPSTSTLRLVVCAYDKATQKAEISGTFVW